MAKREKNEKYRGLCRATACVIWKKHWKILLYRTTPSTFFFVCVFSIQYMFLRLYFFRFFALYCSILFCCARYTIAILHLGMWKIMWARVWYASAIGWIFLIYCCKYGSESDRNGRGIHDMVWHTWIDLFSLLNFVCIGLHNRQQLPIMAINWKRSFDCLLLLVAYVCSLCYVHMIHGFP